MVRACVAVGKAGAMLGRAGGWRELERWLKPVLARLSHLARRAMRPRQVAGLIGPGERKSIQPMAERLGLGGHDRLHHFVSAGVWDAAPIEAALVVQTDRLLGGPSASLVIEDTALPKKGSHSVGGAPQYASALGKNANCQTRVSLTLARAEVPCPGGAAPLPARDLDRRSRAAGASRCAGGAARLRTKPEMVLAASARQLGMRQNEKPYRGP